MQGLIKLLGENSYKQKFDSNLRGLSVYLDIQYPLLGQNLTLPSKKNVALEEGSRRLSQSTKRLFLKISLVSILHIKQDETYLSRFLRQYVPLYSKYVFNVKRGVFRFQDAHRGIEIVIFSLPTLASPRQKFPIESKLPLIKCVYDDYRGLCFW